MVTAANVHDKHSLSALLKGTDQRVYGDSAYANQKALVHAKSPQVRSFTNQSALNNPFSVRHQAGW
jgi:IS5 family transposase